MQGSYHKIDLVLHLVRGIIATSTLYMWNKNVVQQYACMYSCHFSVKV
jgi:hypothetical protein